MPVPSGREFTSPLPSLRHDFSAFAFGKRGPSDEIVVKNLADGHIHRLRPGTDFDESIEAFRRHLQAFAERHGLLVATKTVCVIRGRVAALEILFAADQEGLEEASEGFSKSPNLRYDFTRFTPAGGGPTVDLTDGQVWRLRPGADYEIADDAMVQWIRRYAQYFGLAALVYTYRKERRGASEGLQVAFADTDERLPSRLTEKPRLQLAANPSRQTNRHVFAAAPPDTDEQDTETAADDPDDDDGAAGQDPPADTQASDQQHPVA